MATQSSRAAEGIPLGQGENGEHAVGWPRTSPRLPNSSRSFDEALSASSRSGLSLIGETEGGKQDRQEPDDEKRDPDSEHGAVLREFDDCRETPAQNRRFVRVRAPGDRSTRTDCGANSELSFEKSAVVKPRAAPTRSRPPGTTSLLGGSPRGTERI